LRGEGVITQQRAGRGGAAKTGAARRTAAAAAQRPAARKTRPQQPKLARAKGDALTWKRAMVFVPLALKLLLAVAFGVILFIGYQRAASASFFRVASVDVGGERRASRKAIEETVAGAAADGVWRADLEEISRRVRRLPWVRTAVVTRVLPGQLRVRVTEREPRVIARVSSGRFVWVADDGVALGPANPDGEDFTVRGIEEADAPTAQNRKRVELALEMRREWERAGLSGRVSEVNLADLDDVRVQLTGEDAGIEVRLGGGVDHVKLFHDALRALDLERQAGRSQNVLYIVMLPGKSPILGLKEHVRAAPHEPAPAEAKPRRDERERPRDAGSRPNGEAQRPRRAG
jgi:hypothetical protein